MVLSTRGKSIRDKGPLICLVVVGILFHLSIDLFTQDSVDYARWLQKMGLVDFTIYHYQQWSSRNVIEAVLVLVAQVPKLWAVMDIGVMASIFYSLRTIFNPEHNRERDWAIAFLILCYPADIFMEAGVIATALNYPWPLAALLYVIASQCKAYRGEKLSGVRMVLTIACLIFSANLELVAVVYVGAGIAWLLAKKHEGPLSRKLAVTQLAVGVISLIHVLLCPGNKVRLAYETERYIPDFPSYSVFDKAYLGFVSTFNHYLFYRNLQMLVFSIALIYALSKMRKARVMLVVGAVPLLTQLGALYLTPVFARQYPLLGRLFYPLDLQAGQRGVISPTVQLVAVICMVVALIYLYWGDRDKLLLTLAIFVGGMGTRVAMGFSSTLYASGARTFIFFDFALSMLALQMLFFDADEKRTLTPRLAMLATFAFMATSSMMQRL